VGTPVYNQFDKGILNLISMFLECFFFNRLHLTTSSIRSGKCQFSDDQSVTSLDSFLVIVQHSYGEVVECFQD
jgi:hypothetical protein